MTKVDRPDPYRGLPPFEATSDTSIAAALTMVGITQELERRVLNEIWRCGERGCTDDEIEQTLGLRHQTASARRRTLELKGAVRKTENRRRTRSNRNAAVYVAVLEEPPKPTQGVLFAEPTRPGPAPDPAARA